MPGALQDAEVAAVITEADMVEAKRCSPPEVTDDDTPLSRLGTTASGCTENVEEAATTSIAPVAGVLSGAAAESNPSTSVSVIGSRGSGGSGGECLEGVSNRRGVAARLPARLDAPLSVGFLAAGLKGKYTGSGSGTNG